MRRNSDTVVVGDVRIGGRNRISVQSMLDFAPADHVRALDRINGLTRVGCDIIRVSVKNYDDIKGIGHICRDSPIPVVADIHFDADLAVRSIEAGCDKIRINPGNIGSKRRVREVLHCAAHHNIPVRIGVNSGSLPKKYIHPTPEAITETALTYIDMFHREDFRDIVLSMKSTDIITTVRSYEMIKDRTTVPFHVGITEAGIEPYGIIKSSAGIGILLEKGLVDTMRVSLTASLEAEVHTARALLRFMGHDVDMPEIISCPTCGRCEIDLDSLAHDVDRLCRDIDKKITVAVMGCVVNGPGEAKEADIGIAGGRDCGIIFVKGKIVEKVESEHLLRRFRYHLNRFIAELAD
ncbi:MAG: flavodoxin-dependent (E)-4-hydroxy-3-methylbut-2-enyl-diphosphate synthase [Candidatus Muiribacteriaceae bacterium]